VSSAAGHPARARSLAVGPPEGAVGRCRDFVRKVLAEWGWPAGPEQRPVLDDVLLIVSELAANARMFAGGPEELRLRLEQGRLLVEIADASPAPPVLRPTGDPARPGGHGLHVVDRLARAWGYELRGGGKTVWCEVAARRPAGPAAVR
jgi:anti-sigma regulatory factor (Ser/Thr protein kinase)